MISKTRLNVLGSLSALFLSAGFLIASGRIEPTDVQCMRSMSSWSPAWDIVEHKWVTFQNGFSEKSVYRGEPTPELESAWSDSIQDKPVSIPKWRVDELGLADATPSHQSDTEVMAYLEVFRNLACLNLLRQHTYRDEYDYSGLAAFQGGEKEIMGRVDGCVQRLREVLLCSGDATPYLVMLTPQKSTKESPDFNTLHYCRNFDDILEWTRVNEVKGAHDMFNLYKFTAV